MSGLEPLRARAAYGCSPGDETHPEPYVHVAPWAPAPGRLWQATAFAGAELSRAELLEAADQRAVALEFLRERLAALTGERGKPLRRAPVAGPQRRRT